jgi:hypothetical protein
MRTRLGLILCGLLLPIAVSQSAFAKGDDRVQFGNSIHVAEGEEAGDLVCIGCSIYVQGTCGDVVAVGGSVLIEGKVKGDMVVVGGSGKVGENARVGGDVAIVGGQIFRDPNAVIQGDVNTRGGAYVLPLLILIPLLPVILVVALIWWLVTRNRRPVPVQGYPVR